MSGRKSNLLKFQNITAQSMAADITSAVTNILQLDNIGVQVNWTGTSPVGVISVQVSIDYEQDFQGNVINAGNWIDVELPSSPAVAADSGSIYIDLNQLSAPWIRVFYDRTSGVGTLNAFICGKSE